MNDVTFSQEYLDFVMPSIDVLREEEYICGLSETEKELYFLRRDLLNGKVLRSTDERYDPSRTCYEDAVGCSLFWARESGRITAEEEERLYKKYA